MFDPWLLWVILVTALWTSFARIPPPGHLWVCGAAAAVLLLASVVSFMVLAWRTCSALAQPGSNRATVIDTFIRGHLLVSVAVAAVLFFLEPIAGWRTVVANTAGLSNGELVDGLLLCLTWLPIWAIRIYTIELVHAQREVRRGPTPRSLVRSRRIGTEFRQQVLPLLAPLVLFWTVNDLGWNNGSDWPPWLEQTLTAALGVAFMLALPWLLAWFWKAHELPPTETVGLAEIEVLLGVRVRRRWLWPWLRPQALVLIIPRHIHVYFSTGLWQKFDPAGRHAVYAHELAHVRCGHLLRRGVVLLAPLLLVTAALLILAPEAPPPPGNARVELTWQKCVQFSVLVITLATTFSWVARLQELQADTTACAVLSRLAERPVQAEPTVPARLTDLGPIHAHAVTTLCDLFTTLAQQSSIPETHQGWLHPSLFARKAWLHHVLQTPAAAGELDMRLKQIHWVALAVTLLSMAVLASM